MSDENETPPPANPPADPPANPPADPPAHTPSAVDDLIKTVSTLSSRVDDLSGKVESLTPVAGPPDVTPVRRPWTARGRR